jgi:hypothetical protein
MFIRNDDTITLVDNPDAAPEDQNTMVLRRRINLAEYGLLLADDLALRQAQGGSLMTVQQLMIYLCYYLVAWYGPTAPRDHHGDLIPPSHELIAQLDYTNDLVYAALQKADELYQDQFLKDPTAGLKKKAIQRLIRAGKQP